MKEYCIYPEPIIRDIQKCCKSGNDVLPYPLRPPDVLIQFYEDDHFMHNIRAYNCMFSMTSFGAKKMTQSIKVVHHKCLGSVVRFTIRLEPFILKTFVNPVFYSCICMVLKMRLLIDFLLFIVTVKYFCLQML